jgi:transposase
MDVTLHHPEDGERLTELIRQETSAKQRDRYRVVALATAGEQTPTIMGMLGRSRGFVQRWAYAYRDGGLDAIAVKPQPGRPPMLPNDQHETFRRRVLDGPVPGPGGDGVTALRGQDMQRILEEEFGVSYSLSGLYDLLHRLGLSVLVPRPRHRKSDPQAMAQWIESAPFLSRRSGRSIPGNTSLSGSRTRRASASRAR